MGSQTPASSRSAPLARAVGSFAHAARTSLATVRAGAQLLARLGGGEGAAVEYRNSMFTQVDALVAGIEALESLAQQETTRVAEDEVPSPDVHEPGRPRGRLLIAARRDQIGAALAAVVRRARAGTSVTIGWRVDGSGVCLQIALSGRPAPDDGDTGAVQADWADVIGTALAERVADDFCDVADHAAGAGRVILMLSGG